MTSLPDQGAHGPTFAPWHSCSACHRPIDLDGVGHGPDACPHCGAWPLTLSSHYSITEPAAAAELESEPA